MRKLQVGRCPRGSNATSSAGGRVSVDVEQAYKLQCTSLPMMSTSSCRHTHRLYNALRQLRACLKLAISGFVAGSTPYKGLLSVFVWTYRGSFALKTYFTGPFSPGKLFTYM